MGGLPKKIRAVYMNVSTLARIVLITLLWGWLSAAVAAGMLALLQYQEIVRYFPADQVAAQFQAHLDREIWHGSLLLFVQIGLLGGSLWWQLSRHRVPVRDCVLCAVIVALVQAGAGWLLGVPHLFLVPMIVSLIVIGWLTGIFNEQPINNS